MIWLRPILPAAARLAVFIYFRIRYAGEPVPADGPVLLVANHPNSLLDAIVVMAAARRPVQFLAKAPLFRDPKTAWLVKGAGAIPVYRGADAPAEIGRNADAFEAVYGELARGAAVGIFPEGISHSEPALAPLRKGAARIALGAVARTGAPVRIVPVGILFQRKDLFRSEALVVTGPPIAWGDLAGGGSKDAGAVRNLTTRIAAALSRVTLNLERWADRRLVEVAAQIWETEKMISPEPSARLRLYETTTRLLATVRRTEDSEGVLLARDLERFGRRLHRLRLSPPDLSADVGSWRGVSWSMGKLYLLTPLAFVVSLTGWLLFILPTMVTGWIVDRAEVKTDERSTWKLLVGMAANAVWIAVVAALSAAVAVREGAGTWGGVLVAGSVLLGMPLIGMAGQIVRERWRGVWRDASRFFLFRARRELIAALRVERAGLASRMQSLYERLGVSAG